MSEVFSSSPDSNASRENRGPILARSGFRLPLLHRYVLTEVIGPFFASLFVFTGVLFLARVLKLVDLVMNKNVPVGDIVLLFSYVVPSFLEIAIPMALLLGILLAFGRLSSDSELVVMRTIGLSLEQLAKPVLSFAFLAFVASALIAFWIRPWANYKLGLGMFEIVKLRTSAGLSPGVFNDFGPLTIYAESVDDRTGRLSNVIIADRREPETSRNFIARYGQVVSDADQRNLSLQLFDGSIQEGVGLNFNVTSFEVNNIQLPQSELLEESSSRAGKRSNELSFGELIAAKNTLADNEPNLNDEERLQLARYRVEFQKRLAVPFSAFCVALAAMALGIQPSRGGRSWGTSVTIGFGVALILVYYLLLAIASAIASQDKGPAFVLMWIPNILFASLGIFLFRQVGSERWQAVTQALGDFFARTARRMSRQAEGVS